MAINYYWQISQMDTKPQEGDLIDVVVRVHWTRVASTTVDSNEFNVNNFGTIDCTTPSETDFTAYPDLTFNQVCTWVEAQVDVVELDAQLTISLEAIVNPSIIVLPNPWETTNM